MTRHHLPFPDNLTPAERRAVRAVIRQGCPYSVAARLRVRVTTINSQLQAARDKAGASTTLKLVSMYLNATRRK